MIYMEKIKGLHTLRCKGRFPRFYQPSFIASLCMLIIACGGSSSEPTMQDTPSPTPDTTDTTSPTITLNGSEAVAILLGTEYIDAGATALDNVDGNLTAQLTVTNNLNTNILGTYTFQYNVVDSANNQAIEVTREVNVVEAQPDRTFFAAKDVITIGENTGGFTGMLDNGDRFGRDHAEIGDINGDGINDVIVGARSDDDGEIDAGAVYIVMMNDAGSVDSYQKISNLEGSFTEGLLAGNFFGYGVAGLGDIDMDGIPDIAVTAPTNNNQALFVIHLNADGTVKSWIKHEGINGQGLSALGDIDGDGIIELIAANPRSSDGGNSRGAIQLLFFNQDSTIRDSVTISSTEGGFGEGLNNGDEFGGRESAFLGDIDGDGTIEIAVGAFMSDSGRGAIWILSLDPNTYMVTSKVKIGAYQGGFNEELPDTENENGSFGGQFGHALASVGDLNGDGIADLISAANQYEEGYAYLLYLNSNKTVKTYTRINNTEGGFNLSLSDEGRFGRSISYYAKNDSQLTSQTDKSDFTLNLGGGAGTTGTVFSLQFQECEIEIIPSNYYWQSNMPLFSNWSHAQQEVSEPLSFEQCLQKSADFQAPYITHNPLDDRCIIQPANSELWVSDEQSVSYVNQCFNE